MGQIVRTGTISGAIGGAVAVLAIAISARTGTALEPQNPASAETSGGGFGAFAADCASRGRHVRPRPTVDYEREIQPILSENCLECHSQDKRKGGLSLANYADVLDGGKDGAVVRPGNVGAQPDHRAGEGRQRRPDAARRAAVERRADRARCSAGSIRARG